MTSRLFMSDTMSLLLPMNSNNLMKSTVWLCSATTNRWRGFGNVLPCNCIIDFTLRASRLMTKWMLVYFWWGRGQGGWGPNHGRTQSYLHVRGCTHGGEVLCEEYFAEPEDGLVFGESGVHSLKLLSILSIELTIMTHLIYLHQNYQNKNQYIPSSSYEWIDFRRCSKFALEFLR